MHKNFKNHLSNVQGALLSVNTSKKTESKTAERLV